MNFSGWVAIPRSILNNTHTSRLSNTEQLVLMTLMLLADAKTGSGLINAPSLRTYLPELSYPAAKRTLQSLEDKRKIFRQIVPASTRLYRYWIHGYQISDGPHKMSWIRLSKVFSNQDIRAIEYSESAPEDVPETVLEGVPAGELEGVPNNNNDKDNHKDKDNPSISREVSECDSKCETVSDERSERYSDSCGESRVSERCADETPDGLAVRYGLEFRDGTYFAHDGEPVHPNAIAFYKDQMRSLCN